MREGLPYVKLNYITFSEHLVYRPFALILMPAQAFSNAVTYLCLVPQVELH